MSARATQPPEQGLRWGIKRSFLSYIMSLPDGRCSVTDGASVAGEADLLFTPVGRDDPAPGRVVLRYRGDIRFAGHVGMLFVRVADPELTLDGTAGEMSVVGVDPETGGAARVRLATFQVSSPAGGGSDVRLTPEGAEQFNTVYPAGEQFEDLFFTVAPGPSGRV